MIFLSLSLSFFPSPAFFSHVLQLLLDKTLLETSAPPAGRAGLTRARPHCTCTQKASEKKTQQVFLFFILFFSSRRPPKAPRRSHPENPADEPKCQVPVQMCARSTRAHAQQRQHLAQSDKLAVCDLQGGWQGEDGDTRRSVRRERGRRAGGWVGERASGADTHMTLNQAERGQAGLNWPWGGPICLATKSNMVPKWYK